MAAPALLSAVLGQSLYEVAATPLTYLVVGHLKRVEDVDAYDDETNLTPFAFD